MALAESELPSSRSRLAWRLAADDSLARAAGRGDEAAFAALFARHQPALLRYARSLLHDDVDAQDATQSAFVAALAALRGTGPRPIAVRGWLFRIAHNEAMAVLRARQGSALTLEDDALEHVAGADAGDVRARLRELVGDLQALPERQRAALLMRELSGLGYDEIAVALGGSAQAMRQTVFEARTGLAAARDGRGLACDGVRASIMEGDGRTLRGRALRAHLTECGGCTAFAEQAAARRRDLRILVPAGPALAVAGWLFGGGGAVAGGTAVAGGGLGLGGSAVAGGTAVAGGGLGLGGSAVAGGTAATSGGLVLGLGASTAAKCAAVCATALALGAGTLAVHDEPRQDRPVVIAQAPQPRVATTGQVVSAGAKAANAAAATITRAQRAATAPAAGAQPAAERQAAATRRADAARAAAERVSAARRAARRAGSGAAGGARQPGAAAGTAPAGSAVAGTAGTTPAATPATTAGTTPAAAAGTTTTASAGTTPSAATPAAFPSAAAASPSSSSGATAQRTQVTNPAAAVVVEVARRQADAAATTVVAAQQTVAATATQAQGAIAAANAQVASAMALVQAFTGQR